MLAMVIYDRIDRCEARDNILITHHRTRSPSSDMMQIPDEVRRVSVQSLRGARWCEALLYFISCHSRCVKGNIFILSVAHMKVHDAMKYIKNNNLVTVTRG